MWGVEKWKRRVKTKWEGGKEGKRNGMLMSPTSDTSSCFYGDQGANHVALLRTVLLRAHKRVECRGHRCSSRVCKRMSFPHSFLVSSWSCFEQGSLWFHCDVKYCIYIFNITLSTQLKALSLTSPSLPPPLTSYSMDAPCYITRAARWQPVFVTGRETEREWAPCAHAILLSAVNYHLSASRMDKPSVWRAVVSSTDPRRTRDPASHSNRPGSAMGYRLYDM